jgi:thiol-disulfide isomerase/thioredoxin
MIRALTFLFQLVIAATIIGGSALWLLLSVGTKREALVDEDVDYRGWVGKSAQLEFTALDGRRVNLADMRGRVVLLNFWASWCDASLDALPGVKAAYDKFHDKGFEVVGVNFDDDKAALDALLETEKLPWPQYFDGAGVESPVAEQFQITHYPSLWLMDKRGVIRYVSASHDLEKKIAGLLAENESSSSRYLAALQQAQTVAARVRDRAAGRGAGVSEEDAGGAAASSEGMQAGNSGFSRQELARLAAAGSAVFQQLSLRGVGISAVNSTAILNCGGVNHTLIVGEDWVVKTVEGPVTIRCDEIQSDAVTVIVPHTNLKRVLRLR